MKIKLRNWKSGTMIAAAENSAGRMGGRVLEQTDGRPIDM